MLRPYSRFCARFRKRASASIGKAGPGVARPGDMPSLGTQLLYLVILALPIACVSWTVTHEEVFREPREWCVEKSKVCRTLFQRKFFYLFTCEYCFSHYVTILALVLTRFTLLLPDWRGYILAGFSLVWVANSYMSLFGRLRLDIRHERQEIEITAQEKTGSGPAAGTV
jgi:hypothetical protein